MRDSDTNYALLGASIGILLGGIFIAVSVFYCDMSLEDISNWLLRVLLLI